VKPNAYTLLNERIGIREGDEVRLLDGLSTARVQRIRGMIRLRDAVRRCLRAQVEGADGDEIQATREQLNRTYDRFVANHGPVSERANTAAFRGDPDLPLLLSLEHYDSDTRRVTKAAIFRERTIQPSRPPSQVTTAQDALLVALAERSRVDLRKR
jgi:N12 class adenine-specific DNA methylase